MRHPTLYIPIRLLAAVATALLGCDESDTDSSGLFGLEQRDTVTTLTFADGAQPGTLERLEAFPSLSFQNPVFLTAPGDGTDRVCVVEQGGRVHIFPNSSAVTSTSVFLDITDRVHAGGEEGLLGLTFHPDYAQNGYFFVHYSASAPRRSVIARFQVSAGDPDAADAGSETILLEIAQPFANHNGGMLAFGPDGMLYASIGDGGSGGDPQSRGQDLTSLLGSVLRIQPEAGGTYTIPSDNPFFGQGNGVEEEIFAYGLRHPWRFSFDRLTGDLWLGDVGQNAREEINVVRSGDNLGWRHYEGTFEFNNPNGFPPTDFAQPIHDYGHTEGNAVIGGFVYRGPTMPSFVGRYIYGDNGSGTVWALVHDDFDLVWNTVVANVPGLSSFGEDENGELYAVSLGGKIYRFREASSGPPPPFPQRLSETGIFADLDELTAAPGLIEYDVNMPLWSDGAVKRRWIALPGQGKIRFDPVGAWNFPVGTVFVKHFELNLRAGDPTSAVRLETRVFIHEQGGWAGYCYRWNAAQTDAVLLAGAETENFVIQDPDAPGGQRVQAWNFPSRAQCLSCHTEVAGFVLGARTRQLNREFDYASRSDNQLRSWNHIELFSSDIGAAGDHEAFPDLLDTTISVEQRARAYLSVHCANCHQQSGPTNVTIDLRFDLPPAATNAFNVRPLAGDLGLPDAFLIKPGVKESSVLWERPRRLDGTRMPPLGSTVVDDEAVNVIGEWIDASR